MKYAGTECRPQGVGVRQGCISLGKVQCDGCQNIIPYAGRYLIIHEEDGVEAETGERHSYCVACSTERGYTEHRDDKAEPVLTFFPTEREVPPPTTE